MSEVTLGDVPLLIKCIAVDNVIMKIKTELDQFLLGLGQAGVLTSIQRFPQLFRSLFVSPATDELSASMFLLGGGGRGYLIKGLVHVQKIAALIFWSVWVCMSMVML